MKKRLYNGVCRIALGSVLLGVTTCCLAAAQATQSEDLTSPVVGLEESNQSQPQHTVSESTSRNRGVHHKTLVAVGKSVELGPDDSAEVAVAIGGSVRIRGKVTDSAVAIAGDVEVEDEGEVLRDAVSVLGNIRIAPGGKIRDGVAVGGSVKVADGATVTGSTDEVNFGMVGLATPEWLKDWFVQCLLKLRPLAPQVPWVWGVAGAFFLLYLLITLLFPKPVQACVNEFRERPATSFLMGILTQILVPLIFLVLAATGLGLLVFPFLLAALVLGAIVGKVALIQAFGVAIGRHLKIAAVQTPVGGFVLGSVLIAVLYIIPVLGLIIFGVTAVWGIGAAATAAFGGLKTELPKKPLELPAGLDGLDPKVSPPASIGGSPPAPAGDVLMTEQPVLGFHAEVPPYPKATFWERMGAAFLDVVLVSILGSLVGGPPLAFVVALAYFGGMWGWKGTTIGGVVLGLKVARMDGTPVTFLVALVRGLMAGFSAVVLFLGFLWIAWDKDKQAWHDKVAGTVVLKLPRGTPLICL